MVEMDVEDDMVEERPCQNKGKSYFSVKSYRAAFSYYAWNAVFSAG
eukprot:CAMPEP_0198360534 /NCGR_PEP_ID=MMETSP1450-20131203/138731_1 /TAXON_ID=753684 ORGANISM="Madagascaria erythrocladiodes, Strain CCMP3234" /NCGR_SAMPLE_ID=MMETSP1450 /ASSEMBLY_ACC=CAM_ASM_001115 /LENGTH=45 /DNA_ID= /DNA_START= /DNA_END= /DNA_ORIENTATION=